MLAVCLAVLYRLVRMVLARPAYILERRLARGEITSEQYEAVRLTLGQGIRSSSILNPKQGVISPKQTTDEEKPTVYRM